MMDSYYEIIMLKKLKSFGERAGQINKTKKTQTNKQGVAVCDFFLRIFFLPPSLWAFQIYV